ncbi:hypothetical protein GJ629_07225 [Halapricum sp. CBA1109]|uniref:hypothetical protein n=1 Tax=Halapricum sp. CBA1109 TaxID=2668068 RepID=UPI0013BD9881|nr:hypothetical protein [Halapricum sp. CBA1109]MUV89714.1 hypothetical protein [Halapricum sp. CBA1109]
MRAPEGYQLRETSVEPAATEGRTVSWASGLDTSDLTVSLASDETGDDDPSFDIPPIGDGSGPPTSLDDDPLLEDVNGDGTGDLFDALAYYNNRDSDAVAANPDAFDFDGDGDAGDLFDALALWNELSS